MKNEFKKGFTLVELSIVLVIIGLLIGGILVAQSLIDSTKIQSFVRQIGQFDAASVTFKDRFGDLPGDADVTISGDNDGYVEDAAGAIIAFDGEISAFWADLSTTGLKNPDGVAYAGTDDDLTVGTMVPEASVGSNLAVLAAGSSAESGNYWWVGDYTDTAGDIVQDVSDSVEAIDAIAIDTKMDDGVGNTGDVLGDDADIIAATDLNTFAGGAYVIGTPVALQIRMGASVGNNQ